MKNLLLTAGLLTGLTTGCSGPDVGHNKNSTPATLAKSPVSVQRTSIAAKPIAPKTVEPAKLEEITKNFDTWYRYTYYNVPLSRDFKALAISGQMLTKKAFLRQLATGKVLALVSGSEHNRPVYQLYTYAGKLAQIRRVSQQFAEEELIYLDRAGKPMPAFRFTDLQGKIYTPATTRGKVLVLKCWFIGCVGCVKEFPEVNALATRYQTNKDVIFISLTTDKAAALRVFLQRKPLNYAVIPDSKKYIEQKLQINGYPTHLVIGRNGKITHVTNSVGYLASAIDAALKPVEVPTVN